MKHKVTAGIVISLMVFVVSGSISFQAMLVCVHGGGDHEQQKVHFHFDQLPGQPCGESREGLSHTTREGGTRHFSLALETLINTQTSIKRLLSLVPSPQLQSAEAAKDPSAATHGGYPFFDPSFVFPDTAFPNTTILII